MAIATRGGAVSRAARSLEGEQHSAAGATGDFTDNGTRSARGSYDPDHKQITRNGIRIDASDDQNERKEQVSDSIPGVKLSEIEACASVVAEEASPYASAPFTDSNIEGVSRCERMSVVERIRNPIKINKGEGRPAGPEDDDIIDFTTDPYTRSVVDGSAPFGVCGGGSPGKKAKRRRIRFKTTSSSPPVRTESAFNAGIAEGKRHLIQMWNTKCEQNRQAFGLRKDAGEEEALNRQAQLQHSINEILKIHDGRKKKIEKAHIALARSGDSLFKGSVRPPRVLEWKCPLCAFQTAGPLSSSKKAKHLNVFHPENRFDFPLKPISLTQIVPMTKEQLLTAAWRCPIPGCRYGCTSDPTSSTGHAKRNEHWRTHHPEADFDLFKIHHDHTNRQKMYNTRRTNEAINGVMLANKQNERAHILMRMTAYDAQTFGVRRRHATDRRNELKDYYCLRCKYKCRSGPKLARVPCDLMAHFFSGPIGGGPAIGCRNWFIKRWSEYANEPGTTKEARDEIIGNIPHLTLPEDPRQAIIRYGDNHKNAVLRSFRLRKELNLMANASSNKSGIRFTDKVWTPKGMKLLVDVLPKDCWAKAGDYVSVQTVIRLREKGYDEHKLEDTKVWKPTNCKRTTYKEKNGIAKSAEGQRIRARKLSETRPV